MGSILRTGVAEDGDQHKDDDDIEVCNKIEDANGDGNNNDDDNYDD